MPWNGLKIILTIHSVLNFKDTIADIYSRLDINGMGLVMFCVIQILFNLGIRKNEAIVWLSYIQCIMSKSLTIVKNNWVKIVKWKFGAKFNNVAIVSYCLGGQS